MKNYNRAIRWISPLSLATLLIGLSLLFIVHASKDERTSKTSSHHHSQDDRLNHILASPVLSDFDDWVNKFGALNYSLDEVDIEKGRVLAVNRRELFKELMALSPKSALDHAISSEVYSRIPASVKKHLETPVSAYGDFKVYVVMLHQDHHSPETMTGSRIEREVTIGDSKYRALVYGRRENITTKLNIPLQGITLDGVMVVDEDPVRRVSPSQYQALHVDRAKVVNSEAVAEVGGKLTYFSSQSELENFVSDQIAWEAAIGPVRGESSVWTEGVKTLLVIRLDFPDRTGEPVDSLNQPLTVTRAQNLINNEVSPFYVNNSFNKTSLEPTITPVVRMPQSQSFYFTNTGALFTDAENAARAAGFEPNNFNLDLFTMSYNQGFGYGGIASVGNRGAALNGAFNLRVTAHELGHNYGLLHANLWRTFDGSIIGPGNNVEYGNPFDVMGGGSDYRAHFTAHYKKRLDWLSDENVQAITQDGVYRVFAHDSTITGGIRVLAIRKNADKNYWIEYRQLFANLPVGAVINWDYRSRDFREVQILDMSPATLSVVDGMLPLGSVFNDTENRIRITVLGKNFTSPESLDIKVELNVGCTFSLTQSSQSFTANGGAGSIPLATQTGCKPSATSNSSWIQAIQGDSSPVSYIVAANYGTPRTGSITVNGQTFTVQQGGATTSCVQRPSGLVAWWQLEGNGLDQTGLNHGALVKNPSFAAGKVGGGILGDSVNNGGYVEVPDSATLTLTKSITIEGWLKVNSPNGWVIRRSSGSPFLLAYDVHVFGGPISFTVWFNNSQGTGIASNTIPLGVFVHFAATLDDDTGRISMYVNGNLVRQSTISQRPNAAIGATTRIGYMDGITDELSVYNRALTAAEILAIYNAGNASTGAAGKCPVNTQSPLALMLEDAGTNNQAVALDSVLFIRDPFSIVNPANLFNLGNDRNTRLVLFVGNLQLAPGESPSAVVVNIVDSNNQTHNIPAQHVWAGANAGFSQVTFRLPDALPPGTCTITVKLHEQISNAGTIRIKP